MQIDSIDPAFAPATGTPETGGWSTRELRTILRGLDGLHIVSADIVEVAPAYDTNAELTTMVCGVTCSFFGMKNSKSGIFYFRLQQMYALIHRSWVLFILLTLLNFGYRFCSKF